jgi:hypothetical protein
MTSGTPPTRVATTGRSGARRYRLERIEELMPSRSWIRSVPSAYCAIQRRSPRLSTRPLDRSTRGHVTPRRTGASCPTAFASRPNDTGTHSTDDVRAASREPGIPILRVRRTGMLGGDLALDDRRIDGNARRRDRRRRSCRDGDVLALRVNPTPRRSAVPAIRGSAARTD